MQMKVKRLLRLCAILAILGGTYGLLAQCLTWNDPVCTTADKVTKTCPVCGNIVEWPVSNKGTHWVIVDSENGWNDYDNDSACAYQLAHNCPSCQGYKDWGDQSGPTDQLPKDDCE